MISFMKGLYVGNPHNRFVGSTRISLGSQRGSLVEEVKLDVGKVDATYKLDKMLSVSSSQRNSLSRRKRACTWDGKPDWSRRPLQTLAMDPLFDRSILTIIKEFQVVET